MADELMNCPFCNRKVIRLRDSGYVVHAETPITICPIFDNGIWVDIKVWENMTQRFKILTTFEDEESDTVLKRRYSAINLF